MSMTRLIIIVTGVIALSACLPFSGKHDPLTVYSPRLAPYTSHTPRVDWQLVVETPLASDTLDTSRILVMPTPHVIQLYKEGRWRDRTPKMLQGLLIQALEDSGAITGVGHGAMGLRGDYALAIELRDFQAEFRDGATYAVIKLQAKLLDYASNRVLAMQSFNVEAPSALNDAENAVNAFNQALNQLMPQLVEWTLAQGEIQWQVRKAKY